MVENCTYRPSTVVLIIVRRFCHNKTVITKINNNNTTASIIAVVASVAAIGQPVRYWFSILLFQIVLTAVAGVEPAPCNK